MCTLFWDMYSILFLLHIFYILSSSQIFCWTYSNLNEWPFAPNCNKLCVYNVFWYFPYYKITSFGIKTGVKHFLFSLIYRGGGIGDFSQSWLYSSATLLLHTTVYLHGVDGSLCSGSSQWPRQEPLMRLYLPWFTGQHLLILLADTGTPDTVK